MGGFFRRLFGGGGRSTPAPAPKPKAVPIQSAAQPVGGGRNQAGSRGSARPKGKTTYTNTLGLSQSARSGINLKQLTGE